MDNVTIKSGCNLQGTLICDNTIVNERCELKACIVGNGKHVDAGGKHTNEVLATDDSMEMNNITRLESVLVGPEVMLISE